MNFSDFIFSRENPVYKDDMYIDDIPVESLIYYNATQSKPTPADILTLWAEGAPLSERLEQIVTKILIHNIGIAVKQGKVSEAGLLLEAALEKTKSEDATDYLDLIIALINLDDNMELAKKIKYYNDGLKIVSQHGDKLDSRTLDSWKILCRKRSVEVNPHTLRSRALEKVDNQEYAGAEKLYRQLIQMDFELPGTLCHLARVQLLMNDENGAKLSISRAWRVRHKAAKYVIPRIIFFRILFLMLNKKNPDFWIGRLKAELNDVLAFMDWSISSTLKQYESRLGPDHYQLINLLAEMVQDRKKYEALK